MTEQAQPSKKEVYIDDEIDLFELFEDIKNKWQWLIGTGFICTLMAVIYAFIATPTFQTEVVYRPAINADLYQLNQPKLKSILGLIEDQVNLDTGAKTRTVQDLITAEIAFQEFRSKVISAKNIRAFYNQLLEEEAGIKDLVINKEISLEQNNLKFFELFTLEDPKKNELDVFVKLKFEFENAQLAANILNQYSDFTVKRYISEKKQAVERRIQAQLSQWQIEAENLRSEYLADKAQRLLELKEAAAIAKQINQQHSVYERERVVIGELPLYMMGQKALEAEIVQIEQRSQGDEDLYIKGLPELLDKIKRAETVSINWDQVSFIDVDQSAVIPLSPIKPKKTLIVAIGVVAGGMLGIMLAIMAAAWERRQQQKTQKI